MRIIKNITLLAALLISASAWAGDLTVDKLTVNEDAMFNGLVEVSAPSGDIPMGIFTNKPPPSEWTPLSIPNCIGWWPFDGDAENKAGSGNQGTVIGATYATGKFGQSIHSLGNSYDQVTCDTAPASICGANPRTLSLWFKVPAFPNPFVFCGWGVAEPQRFFVLGGAYPQKAQWWGAWGDLAGTTTLVKDVWYHVAATYDGITVRLYVNGIQEAQDDWTLDTPQSTIEFGGYLTTRGWTAENYIDQVAVYDRALTAAEIARLYED